MMGRARRGEGEEAGRPSSRLKGQSSLSVSSSFCPVKVGEVKDKRERHCGGVIAVQHACLSGPYSVSCSVQLLPYFNLSPTKPSWLILYFLRCFPVFPCES